MAIKIIKQGTKEFHITCPYCGCEFTYENEDVCNSEVICPCCLTNLPHKGMSGKVDEAPLPTNGGYGTITNPHGTYPYNDLVYRPIRFDLGQTYGIDRQLNELTLEDIMENIKGIYKEVYKK